MSLIRVVRRLTTIGATIVLISSVLPWVVIITPTGPPGGTPPPLSVPILGVALLMLSLFPARGSWRSMVALVLVGAAIVAGIVSLWALAESIFQVTTTPLPGIRLGAGPVVALIGALSFALGVVAFLQSPEEDKQIGNRVQYGVMGLDDSSGNGQHESSIANNASNSTTPD